MNAERRELALPDQLKGPFQSEYDPAGQFRHPGAQLTSVLFYRSGGHSVVNANGKQHVDKRFWAKPFTVIEVANGRHNTSFELELPAAGGATFFRTQVDVQWSVENHYLVVMERLVDVTEVLGPRIKQRLQQVSERFPVDDAQGANQAVNAELRAGAWRDLGADVGLRTEVYVRMTVDAKAVEYSERYRDLRWEQREAEVAQETARLKEHHQGELTSLRMGFFRAMLEGGQGAQINFMLSQDPDNAGALLAALRQEQRDDRAEMLTRVMEWVSEGVIQSPDIERHIRGMLLGGNAVTEKDREQILDRIDVHRVPPEEAKDSEPPVDGVPEVPPMPSTAPDSKPRPKFEW